MKKHIISCLALALVAALPLKATSYNLYNSTVVLSDGIASPWTVPLNVQLGVFDAGFNPTTLNLTDWVSNWHSPVADTGYYDPSTPELTAGLTLADNSEFADGAQLFLWVFDDQVGLGSKWALYTDASWLVAANSDLDLSAYYFDFTASTTTVFGGLDLNAGTGFTSTVAAAAVPDSMSVASGLGLALLGLAAFRRKFASHTLPVA